MIISILLILIVLIINIVLLFLISYIGIKFSKLNKLNAIHIRQYFVSMLSTVVISAFLPTQFLLANRVSALLFQMVFFVCTFHLHYVYNVPSGSRKYSYGDVE